jgi:preprotein translocase subunit SecG
MPTEIIVATIIGLLLIREKKGSGINAAAAASSHAL